jgi:hypothetical protein
MTAASGPVRLPEASFQGRLRLGVCPISWAPPFEPPWKRTLSPDVVRRLSAWCAELLPGVEVDVVEWVGADPRQPIHALVVGFPTSERSPVVLYRKTEELERHHLERAIREGGV